MTLPLRSHQQRTWNPPPSSSTARVPSLQSSLRLQLVGIHTRTDDSKSSLGHPNYRRAPRSHFRSQIAGSHSRPLELELVRTTGPPERLAPPDILQRPLGICISTALALQAPNHRRLFNYEHGKRIDFLEQTTSEPVAARASDERSV
jgi:hypothetical protein